MDPREWWQWFLRRGQQQPSSLGPSGPIPAGSPMPGQSTMFRPAPQPALQPRFSGLGGLGAPIINPPDITAPNPMPPYGPYPAPAMPPAPAYVPPQPVRPTAAPAPAPQPAPVPPQAHTYGGAWGQNAQEDAIRRWRMLAAAQGQVGQDMPGGLFEPRSY